MRYFIHESGQGTVQHEEDEEAPSSWREVSRFVWIETFKIWPGGVMHGDPPFSGCAK